MSQPVVSRHPKDLQNEVLGLQHPVICSLLNVKAIEYEVFGLVDVRGSLASPYVIPFWVVTTPSKTTGHSRKGIIHWSLQTV